MLLGACWICLLPCMYSHQGSSRSVSDSNLISDFISSSIQWINVDKMNECVCRWSLPPPPLPFHFSCRHFMRRGTSLLLLLLTSIAEKMPFSVSDTGRPVNIEPKMKGKHDHQIKNSSYPPHFNLLVCRTKDGQSPSMNTKENWASSQCERDWVSEKERREASEQKDEWAIGQARGAKYSNANYTYANTHKHTQNSHEKDAKTQTLAFGFDPYSKNLVFYWWYPLQNHTRT